MESQTLPAKEDILGYECRFAVFLQNRFSDQDLHVVKEIVHTKDGRQIPHLRKVYNYKRPFWVAKPAHRKYEQHREWESVDNLRKFESTQSKLGIYMARALGKPGFNGDVRSLLESPYVYGADILSTTLIKAKYLDAFPNLITPYSVACFDTEKDMINGTEEINMATISFKDKIYTAINKSVFAGYPDVINQLKQKMDRYLGEYVKKRNIKWEVELVDSDTDIIINCMNKMHAWKPDFMAIWNINFDLPLMEKALLKKGINPADVFSDPSIEKEFRYFRYKQGPNKRITDSGVVNSLKPAEQWHTLYAPCTSYFIDAMCVYQKIRMQDGAEPSYALDSILQKELGIRKLNFTQAEHLSKVDWHIFMQSKHPFEYVIYNVFDCISMEELDEKTLDLSYTLPLFSEASDFANFKSQPRRLADKLHFECLSKNLVIGVTSSKLKTELDKLTIPIADIIVALPAEMRTNDGLRCIVENENLATNIYAFGADLDIAAAYPTNQAVMNMSKETTKRELISIEGKEWEDVKMQTFNLSGGYTNALEIGTHLLNLPDLTTLLEDFKSERKLIK